MMRAAGLCLAAMEVHCLYWNGKSSLLDAVMPYFL